MSPARSTVSTTNPAATEGVSRARGAASPLFRHRFHESLTPAHVAAAKVYADSCIGQPYVWAGVPNRHRGGDCSGYVSGIICAARAEPVHRLFATGDWRSVDAKLGFHPGLSDPTTGPIGLDDRPFPGHDIEEDSSDRDDIAWIQARLNFAVNNQQPALGGSPLGVDGQFGATTLEVVEDFQRTHGLQGLGMVGPLTWTELLGVRSFPGQPIQEGSSDHASVAWIQARLNLAAIAADPAWPGSPLTVDGEFGPATTAVVDDFRATLLLPPGPVDLTTWLALNALHQG